MAIVLAILAKVSAILESVCENVLEFLFSLEKELTVMYNAEKWPNIL